MTAPATPRRYFCYDVVPELPIDANGCYDEYGDLEADDLTAPDLTYTHGVDADSVEAAGTAALKSVMDYGSLDQDYEVYVIDSNQPDMIHVVTGRIEVQYTYRVDAYLG